MVKELKRDVGFLVVLEHAARELAPVGAKRLRQQDQCAAGVCLTFPWENNAAFCGANCSAASDCPTSFSCVNVEGVGGQCVPENDYCSPSGGNISMGDYCWGPAMCSSGLCLPVPGDAFCTKECTVGSASSCPSGFQCFASTDGGGICIKEGSKGFPTAQESSKTVPYSSSYGVFKFDPFFGVCGDFRCLAPAIYKILDPVPFESERRKTLLGV